MIFRLTCMIEQSDEETREYAYYRFPSPREVLFELLTPTTLGGNVATADYHSAEKAWAAEAAIRLACEEAAQHYKIARSWTGSETVTF
jgi:hypothetical protein